MPIPCPLDVDLVERLVLRIARAEGQTPQVECTTWFPSALAAEECADMDVADRLRRTRA